MNRSHLLSDCIKPVVTQDHWHTPLHQAASPPGEELKRAVTLLYLSQFCSKTSTLKALPAFYQGHIGVSENSICPKQSPETLAKTLMDNALSITYPSGEAQCFEPYKLIYDNKSKLQLTVYLNKEKKQIYFCYGGTRITSRRDFFYASRLNYGAITPREIDSYKQTITLLENLKTDCPPEDGWELVCGGHSQGFPTVLLVNQIYRHRSYLFDPWSPVCVLKHFYGATQTLKVDPLPNSALCSTLVFSVTGPCSFMHLAGKLGYKNTGVHALRECFKKITEIPGGLMDHRSMAIAGKLWQILTFAHQGENENTTSEGFHFQMAG